MDSFEARQIGQKFFHQWIFKDINFQLAEGESLLITGPNGSGKSTLMRIIAGQLNPSAGQVFLEAGKKKVNPHEFYRYLSWTGPYFDLYGDLNLQETVAMHFQFKKCLLGSPSEVIAQLRLEKHRKKEIKHFSSGMFHRLKVGLSIFTSTPLLLLDEATSNLDTETVHYIMEKIAEFQGNRMLVFASNNPAVFDHFPEKLEMVPFS